MIGMPRKWWIAVGVTTILWIACLATGFGGIWANVLLVVVMILISASPPGDSGRK